MRRLLYENGLSIVLFGCFIIFLIGQSITGHLQYNEDQQEHGGSGITFIEYLHSAHFLEATMENWESEFLQMFAYVLFTVFLYQKGSSESKDPCESDPGDGPRHADARAPWPVRKGGFILQLYENSLSLAFFLLFLVSFTLHANGGARQYNREQTAHGQPVVSTFAYLRTSRFWFESFQNWQSEFLAIGSMVVLSVFLRQKGSPESKPVESSHGETGSE